MTQDISNNSKIQLEVPIWQHIIPYLNEQEQRICSFVSKKLRILMVYDPSAVVEKMHQRKAIYQIQNTLTPSYGPSHHFLYSDSLSADERFEIEEFIQNRIQKDPHVAKTVQEVCKIETMHPDYIPVYHAMNINTYVYSLFTRILLTTPYFPKEHFPISAPLIRFPSLDGPTTTRELFDKFPIKSPIEKYDHRPDVQKELLALSPHLFANLEKRGEATWELYLENTSMSPPNEKTFFKMLCAQYRLSFSKENRDKLIQLHKEWVNLSIQFERQNLEKVKTLYSENRGVLLQILIPPAVLDQVAYASKAYGRIDCTSNHPLSKRCSLLRNNPRIEPNMQVRLLAQSLFVSSLHIKVFTYGCGGFFGESLLMPDKINQEDWMVKQEKRIARQKEIVEEVRKIYIKSMLLPKYTQVNS